MKSDRFASRCGWAVAVLLAMAVPALSVPAPPGDTVFPIQPGEVVVTCSAGDAPDGAVLAVFDVHHPAVYAPGLNQNWLAEAYHAPNWTSAVFNGGEIFGVTLDNRTPPNIYATASSSYGTRLGSGKVFRVDGTTGEVTVFADLPNCPASPDCPGSLYAGLGDIAFDAAHAQFFVTNFYDGKIYRLNAAGAVLETFDFGDPFDPAANDDRGFVPLGERPWGVAVHEDRVYFGIWSRDYRPGPANTVWSVALDAAGAFSGPAALEATLAPTVSGLNMPVADISFSIEGRMLLAQRTMINDTLPGTRQARVVELIGGHGAWVPGPFTFAVGAVPRTNSAGGADYVCEDEQTTGVVAMGEALHFGPGDFLYGLQIFPPTGGAIENSYLVDLDHDTSFPDKFLLGSLDVHDVCGEDVIPPLPDVDVIVTSGWLEDTRQKVPFGAADDDWQVVSPGPVRPAVVVENPLPVEIWPRASKVAKWLSTDASGLSLPGAGTVDYRTCFCLGPDAKDAMIMLKLRADDRAALFLNGRLLAGPGGQFRRAEPLMVNINDVVGQGFLQFGENCLTVSVTDFGNRTGFSIAGSFWVTDGACPPAPAQR